MQNTPVHSEQDSECNMLMRCMVITILLFGVVLVGSYQPEPVIDAKTAMPTNVKQVDNEPLNKESLS